MDKYFNWHFVQEKQKYLAVQWSFHQRLANFNPHLLENIDWLLYIIIMS